MKNPVASETNNITGSLRGKVFRTVLFIAAAYLALISTSFFPRIENGIFWLDSKLLQRSDHVDGAVVRVKVPLLELQRFVRDPAAAVRLTDLLRRLAQVRLHGMTLLVERYPTLDFPAEALLNDLVTDADISDVLMRKGKLDPLRQLQARRTLIHDLIADKRLLIGIVTLHFPADSVSYLHANQAISVRGLSENWWQKLGHFRQRNIPELASASREDQQVAFPVFAFQQSADIEYPLLWRVGDNIFPDLALRMYMASEGLSTLTWEQQRYELSSTRPVKPTSITDNRPLQSSAIDRWILSPDGQVVVPRLDDRSQALIAESYEMDSLLAKNDITFLQDKTIMFADDSGIASNVAAVVNSLRNGPVIYQPGWACWAIVGILALFTVYLVLLLPRMPGKYGFFLTVLFALALLAGQAFCLVTHSWWLPLADTLAFLLLGHLFYIALYKTNVRVLASKSFSAAFRHKPTLPSAPVKRVAATRVTPQRVTPHISSVAVDKKSSKTQTMERTVALSASQTRGVTSLGRYEIKHEIGRGAMGIVYLGYDPKISRHVAIKTLNYSQFDPAELGEVKSRFFREARAAGVLNHPNIVTVYDVGEEEGLAFIAMDYVEGEALNHFVKEPNLLMPQAVYGIVANVAYALEYAHKKNVVHRDIKPSNILINRDTEIVKVADFGIARIANESSTRTGDVMGSPLYMSPEQLKGEPVTGATDIYSLGVTFYQLLTGELPFKGDSLPTLTYEIVRGKYLPVNEVRSDVPKSAARIIDKAMNPNQEKRFATAGEMQEAIQRAMEKEFD